MKYLSLLFIIMSLHFANAQQYDFQHNDVQNGKARTIKKTFSRETSVSIHIASTPSTIWKILTDAEDYTNWNSTIISIDGQIKAGEKISLKSKLDEKRVFKLKIKEFEPQKRLVWGDGKGQRTYSILKNEKGGVTFNMHEKIGGIMFPMYAKYIPPFDESFEHFARDLKQEAEKKNRKME